MSKKEREKNYSLDDACLDFSSNQPSKSRLSNLDDIMSKSVFTPDFETNQKLPQQVMFKQPKKKVKEKVEKLPEEMAMNIQVLKMRAAFDPKRFYKRDKTSFTSKQLQIGRVVDSPVDFYSSRLPRKQRRANLVDELLADAEFQQYNKKRFLQIIDKRKKLTRSLKRYRQRNRKQKQDSS